MRFIEKTAALLISAALMATSTLCVFPVHVFADDSSGLGNVLSATTDGPKLILTVASKSGNPDKLTIDVCKDNILRVDYQPNSVSESPDTPMIDPNLSWDAVDATIDTAADPITVTTADMRIEIAKEPCRMTVQKADGTMLFWEPSSGGVFDDGVRFVRASSSNLYGIHSYDCFSSNGELLRNDNTDTATAGQQGNSGGPFMWSTAGYGVLIDSDGGYPYTNSTDNKMEFYYGETPTEGRRYEKDDVEYYIILGQPKEILAGYAKITGTSPMMPKWSLGFSNFEWNINEDELNNMVDTYRAKNIPIDAYALDYDWKKYGEDNYGEFAWNTDNFPSAASTSLKNEMDEKGIKLIGITKPRIVTQLSDGTVTQQGKYAQEHDFFYPGHQAYTDYFLPVTVRSIDPYKADERAWWWQHSQDAFDKGIVGWWNDETDKVSSGDAQYWFGNFSTMFISQALYEGQRNYTDGGTRVWQTARNYYPGTQRYATSIWSGDVATQFYKGERVDWAAGLNEQKVAMLSTINNGQMKWGSDGGGFNQNSGNIENPSPELYTRWLQFAALTPVDRVHGTNYQQRQPWYFGSTAEENAKTAIRMRYSLMPYMYSYEHSAYETGLGLVYPLLYDYPNDENLANYSDAWMFGDYLLVAPITERGASCKWIYLPEGRWIDYNRGTVYEGGQYIPYSLNSETWTDIPMFVKEGGIIPTQDVENYVGEKSVEHLYVDVFPSSTSTSFEYYDDDGQSYNYENGQYLKQSITQCKTGDSTTITVGNREGKFTNDVSWMYFAIHGQAGESVTYEGQELAKCTDYNELFASGAAAWTTSADVYGNVTYVKVPAGLTNETSFKIQGNGGTGSISQKYEAEYASLSGKTTNGMAAVNENHSGYSGTGFVDKLEADEAAITFYVKVPDAGSYSLPIHYSNGDTTPKTLSVYSNGTYQNQIGFEPTGNWDTWMDSTVNVDLAAGLNAIKLEYNQAAGDSGFVNVDYLSVPYAPDTIVEEAENAALWGSAKTNQDHWFYSGTGFVDTLTNVDARVTFDVEIPATADYPVTFRYVNGNQETKNLNLYVNGAFVKTIDFTSVGGNWNEWQNYTENLALQKGRNEISLRMDNGNTGSINIDKVEIKVKDGASPTENLLDNGDFERNTSMNSNWYEWYPDGQNSAYGIDSGSGTNPPESPIAGDKRAYFYSSGAYEQSIHQNVSVPNGTYNVDAWVKVSNTAPTIGRLEIVDYGGDAIYQDMPQTGSGWHRVQVSNVLVTNGTINVGFYVKSSGGTTVHIDAVRLLKVSDAAIQSSESDVDAEEHDIPVTIASTEEQETVSEEASPEESALYEDSEDVEEIATPESAQPASDSTIQLEESEYAQEVA